MIQITTFFKVSLCILSFCYIEIHCSNFS